MPRSRVLLLDPIDVGVCYCGYLASSIFLRFLPSSSSSSSCFPYSRLGSGLPWFLRSTPRRLPRRRRDFSLRPRGSSCCCWSPRAPLGPLVGAVVRHSLFLGLLGGLRCGGSLRAVFLHPRIFTPIWWTSRRACILTVFTAFPSCEVPARWRGLRNVVLGICGK